MQCHSCGNTFADGAPFCPFCGAQPGPTADPPAAPVEIERTVAMDPAALGVIDATPQDTAPERTVAMDAAALGVTAEAPAEDERTVAMSLPPDFFEGLDEEVGAPAPQPSRGAPRRTAPETSSRTTPHEMWATS